MVVVEAAVLGVKAQSLERQSTRPSSCALRYGTPLAATVACGRRLLCCALYLSLILVAPRHQSSRVHANIYTVVGVDAAHVVAGLASNGG